MVARIKKTAPSFQEGLRRWGFGWEADLAHARLADGPAAPGGAQAAELGEDALPPRGLSASETR